MDRSPDITELLAHADWVRGLARELVRDEHRADDVVQETWVAAMRGPPNNSSNVRGWLSAVVRNIARGSGRADVRRIKREVQSARSEAVPPEHELAERARLQHELSEHVLALDEPYRTVLLLRYFEGLAPRAIATRLDIPLATVRTREARAIERLRERLTRTRGGADEWTRELSALVANLPAPATAGAIAVGGLWMSAQAKLWSAVAGVVLSLTALWWFTHDDSVDLAARRLDSPAATQLAEVPISESGPTAERTAVTPPSTTQDADATADRPAVRVESGIILDTHGRPVPDAIVVRVPTDNAWFERGISPEGLQHRLEVAQQDPGSAYEGRIRSAVALLDAPTRRVHADAHGRFELPLDEEQPMQAVVWQPGWANVAAALRVDESGASERVLVVERTMSLTGEVVDRSGAGIANAWVLPKLSLQAIGTFPVTLQDVRERPPEVTEFTDTVGRFTIVGLPRAAGLRFTANAEGFREALSPALTDDFTSSVRIVLQKIPDRSWLEIDGRVVDARGQPLKEAMVYFLTSHDSSDEQGSFRIRIDRDGGRTPALRSRSVADHPRYDLVAVYPGLQPAILADFGSTLIDDSASRSGIVLRLDKPALAIGGILLDDAERARPGVEIRLEDPTQMGLTSLTTEGQARQTRTDRIGADKIVTDPDGRFEVAGLSARDYSIVVYDAERLVAVRSGPIAAGTRKLVLREPASACHENVRGVVLSRTGRPLRGVSISVDFRLQSGNRLISSPDLMATRTDADGRFEFVRVPKDLASLSFSSEGIEFKCVPVSDYVPGSEWRITLPTKARFRVETPSQVGATAIGLLDTDGKELKIEVLRADNGRFAYERAPLKVISNSVCSADEGAATLVVYGKDAEIHRMPIRLDADELTVLRP